MTPRERLAIIKALVPRSGSTLESFFHAHDLGTAYRKAGDGAGKEKKINDALAAAQSRGDAEEILQEAVRHFALGDRPATSTSRIRRDATPDTPFDVLRAQRLHPLIQEASSDLLRDGHAGAAVFEAFKALEVRVKSLTGLRRRSGKDLMAQAFRPDGPLLAINVGDGESDVDEQAGFHLLFMGAMQGVRNPKAHAPFQSLDADRAFEYLAFASLLMRRIDDAERLADRNQ